MKELENVSIYYCAVCEKHIGIFYKWDEVEEETEPSNCPVCNGAGLEFVKDIENIKI